MRNRRETCEEVRSRGGGIRKNSGGDISARKHRRNGLPIVIASASRLGRIKRAVKREFILSSNQPILTRGVLERAYPRLSRFTDWHYLAARRALRQEAEVVARNRFGRGRPNLWAPKMQGRCQPVAK